MIRILYIIDSLTHGGTEKQLVQLIRHLDPEQFCVHLCTLKPSENLYDELDIPKFCLNFISFGHRSIISSVASLVSYVWRNNIDLVQTFFQDPCLLGALVKLFTRVKLIGSFRDLGFWRTRSESLKMKMAYPLFDGFIANSQAVKNNYCKRDGIASQRIEVIYNGFDLAAIPVTAHTHTDPAAPPMVGIVANLNRSVKRVQDFIAAAANVHHLLPDTRFLVVGGGHLQPGLEQQAAELGIGECTTFTGMVPNPLDYIAQLSVGVITSETEGFCNAIIEYMACGLPVVATRAGGNVEMVQEGENGLLYDVGRIEQLSSAILRLLGDAAERNRMATLNRRMVPERFSIGAMVARTSDYYERLMPGAVK